MSKSGAVLASLRRLGSFPALSDPGRWKHPVSRDQRHGCREMSFHVMMLIQHDSTQCSMPQCYDIAPVGSAGRSLPRSSQDQSPTVRSWGHIKSHQVERFECQLGKLSAGLNKDEQSSGCSGSHWPYFGAFIIASTNP